MTEDQLAYLADKLGDCAGYSSSVVRSMLESALVNMPVSSTLPTLRDQFAMAALGGFATMVLDTSDDRIAAMAYTLADAMMKERQK